MKPRSTAGRALLGCALLAGVHLLAVTMLAIQLLLVIAIMTTETWQLALLGTLTVVPVSTLAYGLLAGTSAVVLEGPRIELTPQEQPELWALTLRLAAELDTAPPTTMRLTDTVNASAGERGRLMGLVGGPRTLDLGLPLLLGLTPDELRAVLCHELGHYAGRHTRLASVSHRGSIRLQRTVSYLEFLENDQTSVKPVVRLLLKVTKAYNGLYLRQTLAVRRGQELEADAAAARIAGAHTLARALRTVHALTPLWADLTENPDRPAGPARASGVASPQTLPEGVFRSFARRLADPDDPGPATVHVVPDDGLGSHPPLAVRLATLCPGGEPDSAHRPAVTAPSSAAGLLRELPGLVETLQDALRPADAAVSPQAETTMSAKPPAFDKALLRFLLKINLIGMSLVLAASIFVHTVIHPPRPYSAPFSPAPVMPKVWPVGGSPPPTTVPPFTLPPAPSPSRLSTLPLLPAR
ncbi:M48 family metallopeptidase [Streptomyces sp. SPB162]|uniref:M48 family metallopeptidase n=1 Tax=Streptomyces sp. SPB162 TaxID=2940560 RepID=UPI002405AF8D|nr:M48 family metallopeptidase [Streptomyces sp. SPB162]MDF9811485.1 Zn-dependent protease with chaperone function [Streptomyces sp. SPB162]